MELVGKPGAVGRVQALLGAADPAGLRSRCGAPPAALLHASASVQSAAADIALFFSPEARGALAPRRAARASAHTRFWLTARVAHLRRDALRVAHWRRDVLRVAHWRRDVLRVRARTHAFG